MLFYGNGLSKSNDLIIISISDTVAHCQSKYCPAPVKDVSLSGKVFFGWELQYCFVNKLMFYCFAGYRGVQGFNQFYPLANKNVFGGRIYNVKIWLQTSSFDKVLQRLDVSHMASILHFTSVMSNLATRGTWTNIWGTVGSGLTPGSLPGVHFSGIPVAGSGKSGKPENCIKTMWHINLKLLAYWLTWAYQKSRFHIQKFWKSGK